jgi:hypothetical protein
VLVKPPRVRIAFDGPQRKRPAADGFYARPKCSFCSHDVEELPRDREIDPSILTYCGQACMIADARDKGRAA